MFFEKIESYKNNVALFLDENNKIYYRDILDISFRLQKEIKKRSLVFFLSENSVDSFCGYISLIRAGCVLMILDANIKEVDLKMLISKFEPQYIFCSKNNQKKIKDRKFSLIYSLNSFDLLKNKKKLYYKINDKLMLMLSTSGSLSEPKFVKLSFENIKSNTKSIISYLNLNSKDCSITTMPMSYSYGLSVINSHFISGGSIVPNNFSIVDKKFWKLYSQIKLTNINGVPYFYEILCKVGFKRLLENKLRFITQAGGKIGNKVFNKVAGNCLKNNISFFLMYGQTEASPRISYHKVNNSDLNKGILPIGKPINGGRIYLKSADGSLIDQSNKEGELIYKGKNVFGGYAMKYEDLESFHNTNELATGDIAKKDENKIFYITGRKGRFVKVYGYRINLDFMEQKLNIKNHVACVGVNEKIYIFSENKNLNIINYFNIPKNSFRIIFIKKIPLTNNGKVSYNQLIKLIK